jgi:hypothetical protein
MMTLGVVLVAWALASDPDPADRLVAQAEEQARAREAQAAAAQDAARQQARLDGAPGKQERARERTASAGRTAKAAEKMSTRARALVGRVGQGRRASTT